MVEVRDSERSRERSRSCLVSSRLGWLEGRAQSAAPGRVQLVSMSDDRRGALEASLRARELHRDSVKRESPQGNNSVRFIDVSDLIERTISLIVR